MSLKVKPLYEFTIQKDVTRNVTEETAAGTLTKKVTDSVAVPICIKKPNRRELEEIDMKYAKYLSQCIKDGILTKSMLAKAYSNTGGLLSDKEQQKYKSLYEDFTAKQFEVQTLNYNSDTDRLTSVEKEAHDKKVIKATEEFWVLYHELQKFENEQSQLFNQTAEVIARDKTLLWLTVMFTFEKRIDDDGNLETEWSPFFRGNSFDDKLDFYDDFVESEDVFSNKVSQRAALIISYWYTGKASTQEDFDMIQQALDGLETISQKQLEEKAAAIEEIEKGDFPELDPIEKPKTVKKKREKVVAADEAQS